VPPRRSSISAVPEGRIGVEQACRFFANSESELPAETPAHIPLMVKNPSGTVTSRKDLPSVIPLFYRALWRKSAQIPIIILEPFGRYIPAAVSQDQLNQ
jgi:hypothetical protein